MSADLTFRLARTTAFAVVCLGLGMVAHLFGGGAVSGRAAVCGLVLAFLTALPVTGRERGMNVILPLLAGVQICLHLLFSTAPVLAVPGSHLHSGLIPGLGMLVMHGWAVILTALWLARGEAVLWALLRRLVVRLRLLPVWHGAIPAPPGAGDASRCVPAVLRSALLRHAMGMRAPPPVSR
ncbi:MFS transporter [Nonomuraea sediminis]|uniref:MFS transporter n=1 Tax=Nonomuraea sediminis TaxID=2835864 RepID=UPI001BDD8B48|nr:MFS transporter [Nonomuraea sediminis]